MEKFKPIWILDVIKELFFSKRDITYIQIKCSLDCAERNVHSCGPIFPAQLKKGYRTLLVIFRI